MSYQSSRTTKTYTFSSGGPGGTRTETRTVVDKDGKRTETVTYGGDGGDPYSRMGNRFRDMNMGNGQAVSDGIRPKVSKPVESRYSRGWGSKRDRSTGPPMQLAGKTFAEIRDQCLQEGRLFEDPDFPAVDSSIFYSRAPPRPFVWKRPTVSHMLHQMR